MAISGIPGVSANSGLSATPSGVSANPGVSAISFAQLPSSATSTVGFGDSIIFGQGASTAAQQWYNIFFTTLGATGDNQGISGTVLQNQNLSGGSPQANNGRSTFVARTLGANKKQYVISDYGFNDMRYTGAPATMNLTNFISDYQAVLNGWMLNAYTPNTVIIGKPYFMDTAGFSSGSAGFTGSNDTVNQSYGTAVANLAIEYGCFLFDPYTAMANNGGASLIGGDNIHPTDAGHAVIAASALVAKKNTLLTQMSGVTLISPTIGQLTLSGTAVGGATSYDIQVGISGTFAFATTFNGVSPTNTFTGLAAGNYVGRIRAKFSNSTFTPWAFFSSPITVAGASAPPTIDGTPPSSVTGTTSAVQSITTNGTNRIIIVYGDVSGITGSPAVSGVSDTLGLTWTKRTSSAFQLGLASQEIWWALCPSANTTTVTMTGNANVTGCRMELVAYVGANTTTPFDVDVSLPQNIVGTTATSAAATFSTTNANCRLIGLLRSPATLGTLTRPAGYTQETSTSGTATDVSALTVTSTQSGVTKTWSWTGATTASCLTVDALQSA